MGQQPTSGKQEGDISSVFASLSGLEQKPLPDRFKDIKRLCIKPENEAAVQASWDRLVEAYVYCPPRLLGCHKPKTSC